MKIVVITNNTLKEELLAQGIPNNVEIEWQQEINYVEDADAYIDLLFNNRAERIDKLKNLHPAIVIINGVMNTLDGLPADFIRINGWASFLKRSLVEAAATEINKVKAEKIFSCFNKKMEWVPDVPGFITARVISMIINEAHYALEENVSSKEEIDTAMKLGTNYPYGPFEWGAIIGIGNVYELLTKLAQSNSRYQPSSLLQNIELTK